MSRNVRGNRQVARAIRALSKQVDVPMNAASRYALRPTLSAAKRNVRSTGFDDSTGALANSLIIKKAKYGSRRLRSKHQVGPNASVAVPHVDPFTKKGVIRKPVKYAHFLEFGVDPFPQEKFAGGWTHPGTPKKPFLTPAYYETREQVQKRFGERIGPEMEKRARRLGAGSVRGFSRKF